MRLRTLSEDMVEQLRYDARWNAGSERRRFDGVGWDRLPEFGGRFVEAVGPLDPFTEVADVYGEDHVYTCLVVSVTPRDSSIYKPVWVSPGEIEMPTLGMVAGFHCGWGDNWRDSGDAVRVIEHLMGERVVRV